MGKVFEEICTQYLWKLLIEGKTPIEFTYLPASKIPTEYKRLWLYALIGLLHITCSYRGTQNPSERMPRLSWSLKKEVAHNFGPSHIFKTSVPKDSVIAYYSKGGDEEEILAIVTDNFEIIR